MKYLPILKYILLLTGIVAGALSMNGSVDSMLYISYTLLALTGALVVLMPLYQIAKNPKSAKKSLLGFGVLAAICVISWAMASDEPVVLASGEVLDNVAELKITGLLLYSTYITFAGALLAIVSTEFYKIFK